MAHRPYDSFFREHEIHSTEMTADLGLWQLSLREAALLIAVDLFFAGRLAADVLEAEAYDPADPKLRAALGEPALAIEERLIEAVDKARLAASRIRRDFDECLDPEATRVHYLDLVMWLRERGYEPGEACADYARRESELAVTLGEDAALLRVLGTGGRRAYLDLLAAASGAEVDALLAQIRGDLQRGVTRGSPPPPALPTRMDRPLVTRERRTLLIVLAALCRAQGIDPQARGSAARLRELTEVLGSPLSEDTLRKILLDLIELFER